MTTPLSGNSGTYFPHVSVEIELAFLGQLQSRDRRYWFGAGSPAEHRLGCDRHIFLAVGQTITFQIFELAFLDNSDGHSNDLLLLHFRLHGGVHRRGFFRR